MSSNSFEGEDKKSLPFLLVKENNCNFATVLLPKSRFRVG